jgi:subtilase family serine protease
MNQRRILATSLAAIVGLSTALVPVFGTSASAAPKAPTSARTCPTAPPAGYATCFAIRRTDVAGPIARPGVVPDAVAGYGPADLRSAYKLPSTTRGAGHTVAIVDAFNDPKAESDLATYRSNFGLGACTTANGCFRKVNQTGGTTYPSNDTGWATEISLDLDMVSAICPLCHILLVETTSNSFANLEAGVREAGVLGATDMSLSWGSQNGTEQADVANSPYHQSGRPIVVSSGDSGFGVSYPATSRWVITAGGTRLQHSSNARGWSESAWGSAGGGQGAGSGCSQSNPAVAPASFNTGCAGRAEADLSAVADPNTGVAVYDSFNQPGWAVYGGTSAAAPIIAATAALLPNPSVGASPQAVYAVAAAAFFDVTTGANGTCTPNQLCTARSGWDGPTGRGTPNYSFLH